MRLLGGTMVPSVTNAPAPTTESSPMTAPSMMMEPMPTSTRSLNGAAMQHHVVADGHVVADDERMGIVRHMQHAEILHVRPVAETDIIHITANHGVEPGAALLAHDDVTDHDGRSPR